MPKQVYKENTKRPRRTWKSVMLEFSEKALPLNSFFSLPKPPKPIHVREKRRTSNIDDTETAMLPPPEGPLRALLEPLSAPERREALEVAGKAIARTLSAELVHSELGKAGKGLRQIKRETGLDQAAISRIATGYFPEGPRLYSLAMIAMALGKVLNISFEDPIIDDD